MKFEKLKKIINEYVDLEVVLYYSWKTYDVCLIKLKDGGEIAVSLEPKKGRSIPFLYFNIRHSDLRLSCSSKLSGKYNYFGENQEQKLRSLLTELKEKL